MLVDMWEGNEKFRQQVLDELIKDCIHVEVAGIASATLAVNTYTPTNLNKYYTTFYCVQNNHGASFIDFEEKRLKQILVQQPAWYNFVMLSSSLDCLKIPAQNPTCSTNVKMS